METHEYMHIVFWIAMAGLLFSGYLSVSEVFFDKCALGTCSTVFSIPACVYGFFMYLAIVIFTGQGLKHASLHH